VGGATSFLPCVTRRDLPALHACSLKHRTAADRADPIVGRQMERPMTKRTFDHSTPSTPVRHGTNTMQAIVQRTYGCAEQPAAPNLLNARDCCPIGTGTSRRPLTSCRQQPEFLATPDGSPAVVYAELHVDVLRVGPHRVERHHQLAGNDRCAPARKSLPLLRVGAANRQAGRGHSG
jgi:hypothetical protein